MEVSWSGQLLLWILKSPDPASPREATQLWPPTGIPWGNFKNYWYCILGGGTAEHFHFLSLIFLQIALLDFKWQFQNKRHFKLAYSYRNVMNGTVVTECEIHFLQKRLDISPNTESLFKSSSGSWELWLEVKWRIEQIQLYPKLADVTASCSTFLVTKTSPKFKVPTQNTSYSNHLNKYEVYIHLRKISKNK